MRGKIENQLIVIENGHLSTYALDDKLSWRVGRPVGENQPDIRLYSSTVSRRHGEFRNMDGIWFYLDYNGKNGTVFNGNHIGAGIKGRVKPILLKDGDELIFGGGNEAAINSKTVWSIFCTQGYDSNWRVADTMGVECLRLSDGREEYELNDLKKGIVIEKDSGIAIYMGDITYLSGTMRII